LCGIGVISKIDFISTPQDNNHLIACSLHIPIPLTYTSTVSIECRVFALDVACSAVI
jgi:hypothetical protein